MWRRFRRRARFYATDWCNLARSTFALDSSVSSRHLNEIGVPVRSAFAVRSSDFFPFFCCYCCCCVPFFLPEFQTAQSLDPDREDQKEERPFASSCRLCLFLLVLTLLSCAVFRFGAKSAGKKAEKRYKCAKIGNVDGKPRSPRAAKCRIVCAATALRWLC